MKPNKSEHDSALNVVKSTAPRIIDAEFINPVLEALNAAIEAYQDVLSKHTKH